MVILLLVYSVIFTKHFQSFFKLFKLRRLRLRHASPQSFASFAAGDV